MLSKKYRIISLVLLGLLLAGGYFVYTSEQAAQEAKELGSEPSGWGRWGFHLGLDLSGGTHLVYKADISEIEGRAEIDRRMRALRSLIESRVDGLGVAEPLVQVERGGITGEGEYRLIVELPGVTDTDRAIEAIGETPMLEFRLVNEEVTDDTLTNEQATEEQLLESLETTEEETAELELDQGSIESEPEEGDTDEKDQEELEAEREAFIDERYERTGLDGSLLVSARLDFRPTDRKPVVAIRFNSVGRKLFYEITREHLGERLAILLDGQPISEPVIQQEIRGGEATISGGFKREEAQDLADRLQAGALPVNISLLSTQTIGPTLGEEVLEAGLVAGLVGLALVAVFLLLWYRLSGVLAIMALLLYLVLMLSLFKLIPVTLTAAGIAGFILSIGMAVDANVLIFERMKEELIDGKSPRQAVEDGFARAWLSIRDGNLSSLITAIILYWFGTPLVQGFALVFFVGVLISMFTAITVTRSFLLALVSDEENQWWRHLLFSSGWK